MAKFLWLLVAVASIGVGIVIIRRLRSTGEIPELIADQPLGA